AAQDWLKQQTESSVLPGEDAFELGSHLGARYEGSGTTNGTCCNI
ncbi:alkylmercury lyase, partial [Staphylococcus aureus]